MQTQITATPGNPRGARLREKYFKLFAERDDALRQAREAKSRADQLEEELKRLKESLSTKEEDSKKKLKEANKSTEESEKRIEWLLKHFKVKNPTGQFIFPDGASYKVVVGE